jgi:shikimate dehydrogenase
MSKNFLSNLTGSFSTPADGNPTVAMVEAAYKYHKLDFRYINCEVLPRDLSNAVLGARAMNWAGFNLSIPHKIEIIQYLDGLGKSAQIMGAVNCVVNRNGALIGENTDGKGFLQAFKKVDSPIGKKIAILGAGGAARAIAVELALDGAKDFMILNRNEKRGQELVSLLFIAWEANFKIPDFVDVLINSTSVGMANSGSYDLDIDLTSVKKTMIVADVIVNPPHTNLLKRASIIGAKSIDGLGMVVNQAVIGVKYWTNFDVDPAIMHTELQRVLKL